MLDPIPSLILLCLCVPSICAQERVRLAYHFERLNVAEYQVESRIDEAIELADALPGSDMLATGAVLSYHTLESYGQDGDALLVELRIVGLQGALHHDGGRLLQFDSGDTLHSGAAGEQTRRLLGARARYRLDASGSLLGFEAEGFDPAVREQLRSKWPALPADSVSIGASWSESFSVPVPDLVGSVEVAVRYELAGLEEAGPAGPLAAIVGRMQLRASDDADFTLTGEGTVRWGLMLTGGWVVRWATETRTRMEALGVVQTVEQSTSQSLIRLELTPESVSED